MDPHEEKLMRYISDHGIIAEHQHFEESCHSVADAAKAVNAAMDQFVKNICMIDANGGLIVAIVKGEDKVDLKLVGEAAGGPKPRIATPDEILSRTGYPCGGTPSFGYNAIFLIDERVMEKDSVYSGGGSQQSLLKISPHELQRANNGRVVRIRK